MTLARRSVVSTVWNMVANGLYLVMVLIRSILLARWLPIEIFGIYAAARAIVAITSTLPSLGMDTAFLHRAPEVENEKMAADVHFTIKVVFTAVWVVLMAAYAWHFTANLDQIALLTILGCVAVAHLYQTASLVWTRRVIHRRLAVIKVVDGVVTLTTAVWIGRIYLNNGNPVWALWALLSSHLITMFANFFFLYIWKPVWRPRLRWKWEIVKYYVSFGSKSFLATVLLQLIDRVDDLWTRAWLGNEALGLYSRAYTFSTYPRELVAQPVDQVASGTYAALKGDRLRLSQAFYRTNAFLVRAGFLSSGVLFWIAPEFILLVLTDKWLPMLTVFRLMLIFTMLDPLKTAASRLMVSMGDAARPVPARVAQLVTLLVGLFTLGPLWGIEGVALAVNIMAVVGMIILFHQSRRYVDYSFRKLFLPPLVALSFALLSTGGVWIYYLEPSISFMTFLVKTAVFGAVYLLILFVIERQELMQMLQMRRYLRPTGPPEER